MSKIESIKQQSAKKVSFNFSKFTNLVLAGIVATVAFNVVMYTDIAVTGIPLDIVDTLGQITVGENEFSQTIGHAIHFANGIGLALIFGYVVLPITKKFARLPIILTAISFAIIELVIAVWLGMLPALGAGIAGLDIAPEVPLMTLIRHMVYGLALGVVLRNKVN